MKTVVNKGAIISRAYGAQNRKQKLKRSPEEIESMNAFITMLIKNMKKKDNQEKPDELD